MNSAYGKRLDWEERHRFERAAGWRYGLLVGLALVLAGWGPDAWQLASASFEYWWAKLALAALIILPLSAAAGAAAGRAYTLILLKWLAWLVWGIAGGIVAAYLPFSGMQLVAGLLDPAVRGLSVFPVTEQTRFLAGYSAFWGALSSLFFALLQIWGTARAWDGSAEGGRLTAASAAALALGVPLALVLGIWHDNNDNAALRAPVLLLDRVVQYGLHAPPDLDAGQVPESDLRYFTPGAAWRERFTPRYSLHLAALDPQTMLQSTIDVAFENGFVWRCQTSQGATFVAGCFDVGTEVAQAAATFLQTGQAPCKDCTIKIDPQAAAWQQRSAHLFASGPPNVSIAQHSGGLLTATAKAGGGMVECRLVGSDPVRLVDCSGP
ncbi:MAG: hypothetical protein ACM3JD_13025 [Rudaea sp.]